MVEEREGGGSLVSDFWPPRDIKKSISYWLERKYKVETAEERLGQAERGSADEAAALNGRCDRIGHPAGAARPALAIEYSTANRSRYRFSSTQVQRPVRGPASVPAK